MPFLILQTLQFDHHEQLERDTDCPVEDLKQMPCLFDDRRKLIARSFLCTATIAVWLESCYFLRNVPGSNRILLVSNLQAVE